tara:strand:- start:421 stop:678 length:258 start_codon:yes stop_codon:yes gene_type:complete
MIALATVVAPKSIIPAVVRMGLDPSETDKPGEWANPWPGKRVKQINDKPTTAMRRVRVSMVFLEHGVSPMIPAFHIRTTPKKDAA